MHHPEDYSRKELEQATAHLSNGQKQLLACHIMRNMVLPSGKKPWDMLIASERFAIALVERQNRGQSRPSHYHARTVYDLASKQSDRNVDYYLSHAVLNLVCNAHRVWPWHDSDKWPAPPVEDPEEYEHGRQAALNCVLLPIQALARCAAFDATGVMLYSSAINRHTQRYWAAVYDTAVQIAIQMAQDFRETAVKIVYTPLYAAGMTLVCVKDVSFGINVSPCNPAMYVNTRAVQEGQRLTIATVGTGRYGWWLLTFNEFPGEWYADGAFRNSFIPERSP